MTDIIALIDEVTTPRCGWCRNPLAEDGPSRDFCGELCQGQWTLRCAARDADVDDEAPGYATGGLIPSPAEFRAQPRVTPLGRPYVPGEPWLCSPITPPTPTAILIGGQRHGQTIGVPHPPHSILDVIESVGPEHILFDSDQVQAERVTYRLVCHNGVHWCYVDPRPAAPSRTVHVDGHEPLAIDYHHHAFRRDTWWVTITGQHRGVLCELPGELLADDRAVSTWFAERSSGWPVTDGSWEVTDQRPPWQHDLFPIGARFTLPTPPGVWTITAYAVAGSAETIDYRMRGEQGAQLLVTHEFLTDYPRVPDRRGRCPTSS